MVGVNPGGVDPALSPSLSIPSGRAGVEISVTQRKTGERKSLVEFDLDPRDEIEVTFTTTGIGGELVKEEWVFHFGDSVINGEEGSEVGAFSKADRQRREQVFTTAEDKLAEALAECDTLENPKWEPTAEDYYDDHTIELEDLSPKEHLRVLQDELQDFLFKFRRFLD